MDEFSAALRGAAILRRYEHPYNWWDGDDDDLNDPRLAGMQVLFVTEIQRGPEATISDIEARANAEAIRAWAAYRRVVRDPDKLIINEPGKHAYVAIPDDEWEAAFSIFMAL